MHHYQAVRLYECIEEKKIFGKVFLLFWEATLQPDRHGYKYSDKLVSSSAQENILLDPSESSHVTIPLS